ncbi:NRDE family protein [Solibacillus sp. FSL R7-0682]|uniref:NRDE family protein n=1 Tax=Solibacillus sp. FSL R7-0682 TaxID=2921690 RepID=UPI0030F7CAF5
MCLITFAFQMHPEYPLIVIANRDEFYDRPTAPAQFWADAPEILAGRDLLQGGSWLGVSSKNRFAAITNYRDPRLPESGLYSRGDIVRQFLEQPVSIEAFIAHLRNTKDDYGGYNVLLYDGHKMYHFNNIFDDYTIIEAGVHSLSNATLNSNWPKTRLGKDDLTEVLKVKQPLQIENLLSLLTNKTIASDNKLPDTGVGIHLERLLSPQFIKMGNYGTRCSTAILFQQDGNIQFAERTYEQGEKEYDRLFIIEKNR